VARDIVVIGASAGGIEALQRALKGLPGDLPAATFIVVHTSPDPSGSLPGLLGKWTSLPVAHAIDGEPVRQGRIYVAPPDRHLLLQDGRMMLTSGPRENRFRPAVDPLFRTAARCYGRRVIAVVLSGALNDGTAGLHAVKNHGGVAVVQHPDDAAIRDMPMSAIRTVTVDHIVAADEMSRLLVALVEEGEKEVPMTGGGDFVPDPAEAGSNLLGKESALGPPSGFTCPDCGGALWEVSDGGLLRFRCHVGHTFSDEGLGSIHSEVVENAMWYALRVLEENAALHRRLANRFRDREMNVIAAAYEQRAGDSEQKASIIRQAIVGNWLPDTEARATAAEGPGERDD
jgi:two-component system chemotaxis response regulator CheB